MRAPLALIAAFLLNQTSALASAIPSMELRGTTERCRKTTDPGEPATFLLSGADKGKCIDTSWNRPLQILELDDQGVVFRNLRHRGKWWTARLSWAAIQGAILQVEGFVPVPSLTAIHSQLRIQIDPETPVELLSQEPGTPEERSELSDFVLSFNHAAAPGRGFSIFEGVRSTYMIGLRSASLDDIHREMVLEQKHRVEQFALQIPRESVVKLVRAAVLKSHVEQHTATYNTLKRSCLTQLVDLIDSVFPRELAPFHVGPFRADVTDLFTIKERYLRALRKRGLIDPKRPLAELGDEIGKPVKP